MKFLDACVYAYNIAVHESTYFTPFELMFGRKAVLPVDIDVDERDVKDYDNYNLFVIKPSLGCAAYSSSVDGGTSSLSASGLTADDDVFEKGFLNPFDVSLEQGQSSLYIGDMNNHYPLSQYPG